MTTGACGLSPPPLECPEIRDKLYHVIMNYPTSTFSASRSAAEIGPRPFTPRGARPRPSPSPGWAGGTFPDPKEGGGGGLPF